MMYSFKKIYMPHKIEISDKTYDCLKEYCILNKLKIGQYTDKLIYDSLMLEMYGDVPFTNYRVKQPPREEIVKLVKEAESNSVPIKENPGETTPAAQVVKDVIKDFAKVKPIDEETKAQMIEAMEKVEAGHPQTYITNQDGEKEIQKEMLKQLGVPDKVVNKITRRRLK